MRLADIRQYGMDLKNEWSMSDAEPQMDFEDWTHMQCLELARKAKFWEDNHAMLEENLRIQYDAEFEAFKVSFEQRTRNDFEQQLNETIHADASEITALRKELEEYKISLGKMTNLMLDRDALIKQLQDNAYEAAGTIEEAKDLLNHFVFGDNMRHEAIKWVQEVEKKIIGIMKTPCQILEKHRPDLDRQYHLNGIATNDEMNDYNNILNAMEDYAIQKIEDTVASYEIDRINLVAMTLERDELDEEIKRLGTERKTIIEKNASLSIQNALSQSKLKEAEERATHWYDLYTQMLKRKDQLEEWLQDYQKSLRDTNVFHKNEATIHAITEILNES